MTSPTLAYLSAPLAILLRRILTALSTLSLSQLPAGGGRLLKDRDAAVPPPEPPKSVLDALGLGWTTLRSVMVIPWPWRSVSLQQVELSPSARSSDEDEKLLSSLEDLRQSTPPPAPHDPTPPSRRPSPPPQAPRPNTPLYQLYFHPALFDPLRTPRLPIVLCHGASHSLARRESVSEFLRRFPGLYGFDVRGPSSFPALQMHYWTNVLKVLKGKVGAEVWCPGVPATGSIEQRAQKMDAFLAEKVRGKEINFIAHSMGGLDCRQLITHIKPETYKPRSLLSISTPHRGSAFMDWCTANIGLGSPLADAAVPPPPASLPFSLKSPLLSRAPESAKLSLTLSTLPSSLTSLLLGMLDSPAYANLTTSYLTHTFNPNTPDDPSVKYFSIAGRVGPLSILHPLWLPKMIMDAAGERERERQLAAGEAEADGDGGNDALVSVRSAKWGEYLGAIEECDHWEMRGARGFVRAMEIWGRDSGSKETEKGSEKELREQQDTVRAEAGEVLQSRREEVRDQARGAKEEAARLESEGKVDREEKGAIERLSSIVEWMTEYVPLPGVVGGGNSNGSGSGSANGNGKEPLRLKQDSRENTQERAAREKEEGKGRFPAFDLERFYIALSRKLYDEGL